MLMNVDSIPKKLMDIDENSWKMNGHCPKVDEFMWFG